MEFQGWCQPSPKKEYDRSDFSRPIIPSPLSTTINIFRPPNQLAALNCYFYAVLALAEVPLDGSVQSEHPSCPNQKNHCGCGEFSFAPLDVPFLIPQ